MPASTRERPRSTAGNRRNHYRILHVQPDAPFEVIRANYRTLMQKLRLHPDLGGDHSTAVHVNTAYAILFNPARRKVYDSELLAHYDIATLSRGPLHPGARSAEHRPRTSSGDQRNFYRVLQVQADAPAEVIEASHDALVSRGTTRSLPLIEALLTLRDPARRAAYDRALGLGGRETHVSPPPAWGGGLRPCLLLRREAPSALRTCRHALLPVLQDPASGRPLGARGRVR